MGKKILKLSYHELDDFILDLLYLTELGVPKMPWKHGILNNASETTLGSCSPTSSRCTSTRLTTAGARITTAAEKRR